jgi:adenosylcobyric acid synthase
LKKIAIFHLPFRGPRDEFLPLRGNTSMDTQWVKPGDFEEVFPHGADIVILPGSAKTTSDLQYLRETGGERILRDHVSRGGVLMGICGGFQILGKKLFDPFRRQGSPPEIDGLGFLPHHTLFGPEMISTETRADCLLAPAYAKSVSGEEHRSGFSWEVDDAHRFLRLNDRVHRRMMMEKKLPNAQHFMPGIVWAPGREPQDGLVSKDRRLWGTYIHQVFHADGFCRAVFDGLGA